MWPAALPTPAVHSTSPSAAQTAHVEEALGTALLDRLALGTPLSGAPTVGAGPLSPTVLILSCFTARWVRFGAHLVAVLSHLRSARLL